jgi:hypothetical protein
VLDEWLIVPLRERLERCVIDGGGDNAGITKRVRAVYREWKTQHIDEQLDDVIRAAHGTVRVRRPRRRHAGPVGGRSIARRVRRLRRQHAGRRPRSG